jgi:hypothetical protein
MARTPKSKRKRAPKTILKLPDLEQSQSAVLNSLTSPSSQRSYDHAIREFNNAEANFQRRVPRSGEEGPLERLVPLTSHVQDLFEFWSAP